MDWLTMTLAALEGRGYKEIPQPEGTDEREKRYGRVFYTPYHKDPVAVSFLLSTNVADSWTAAAQHPEFVRSPAGMYDHAVKSSEVPNMFVLNPLMGARGLGVAQVDDEIVNTATSFLFEASLPMLYYSADDKQFCFDQPDESYRPAVQYPTSEFESAAEIHVFSTDDAAEAFVSGLDYHQDDRVFALRSLEKPLLVLVTNRDNSDPRFVFVEHRAEFLWSVLRADPGKPAQAIFRADNEQEARRLYDACLSGTELDVTYTLSPPAALPPDP